MQVKLGGSFGGAVQAMAVIGWLVAGALNAVAQSCPDSGGKLIVSETFGTSMQTGPLPDGQTSYRYVARPCADDGEYTRTATLDSACFSNTWHLVPRDHTPGSAGGNMLLVNGNFEPGEFYRQSVRGLCANTTYEVSVWALNLLRANICANSIQPNLTLRVESADGRVLQMVDLGNLPEADIPAWRRYATVFSVPEASGTVVVRFINNQGLRGCGNDMALDDIELRQCTACAAHPIQVPDAFTPNNDGVNDNLVIYVDNMISFDLTIYDRWGSAVFRSSDASQRWDGTYEGQRCSEGAYTYLIAYRLGGSADPSDPYTQTGRVLLLRN